MIREDGPYAHDACVQQSFMAERREGLKKTKTVVVMDYERSLNASLCHLLHYSLHKEIHNIDQGFQTGSRWNPGGPYREYTTSIQKC